ncbi:MAG: taurine dioxygenase [Candidatus Azotimanducaceae bacterium]|jgi:taurine dioxygenase
MHHEMAYETIQVDSSLGPIGAEVSGIDLSKPLTVQAIADIHHAWLAHGVLFFHDQDLSPVHQTAFAAHLGELDVYPFMSAVEGHPNVIPILKEPGAKMNFGGGWHTDTSYLKQPPKATLLYALEVPDEGGDTEFADAVAAFTDLSDGMKGFLLAQTGVYSPKLVHGAGGDYASVAAKENLGGAYGTTKPNSAIDTNNHDFAEGEVEHPLIRTHDETGAQSIYCGLFHTHRIKGWSREESLPIFRFLKDHFTQEKYVTRFKWRNGSLVLWDNRRLFHNALNDYQGKRRHMQRVIVKGPIPN